MFLFSSEVHIGLISKFVLGDYAYSLTLAVFHHVSYLMAQSSKTAQLRHRIMT